MHKKGDSPATRIPAIGEGKRGIQGHLIYLLRQANATSRLTLDRALLDQGITFPQFSALTMIAAYPDLSSADLARLALQTPQTMNVLVKSFERGRLIRRRPDAIHGRVQRLEMTSKGRRLLTRCRATTDRIEAAMQAELPKTDEAAVRRWLVHVAARLSKGTNA